MNIVNFENLQFNIVSMDEIAAYHRRQKKKGSSRKARYWERAKRASILRVAQDFADKGLPYVI